MDSNLLMGINLSHDSSVALSDHFGNVLFALQEERITREKNICVFPYFSILEITKQVDPKKITEVVVGGIIFTERYIYWLFRNQHYPSFNYLHLNQYPPHFETSFQEFLIKNKFNSARSMLDSLLTKNLKKFGINAKIIYRNHHDSHVATALIGSNLSQGLAISLDGHGDRESGRIKKFNFNSNLCVETLAEIPQTHSLGDLYSAVTRRYNFKTAQHEGKITGLAAYGESGPALEFLLRYVEVKNGQPVIKINRSKILKYASKILKYRTGKLNWYSSFDELVDYASQISTNYADLAFAIQKLLEDIVVDLVSYWSKISEHSNVALSGGVFANVKVNQKIAELKNINKVFVFPNMGDSGLAIGAIWDLLIERNIISINESKFSSMYLDSIKIDDSVAIEIAKSNNLSITNISNSWTDFVSEKLAAKKIIGIIQGKMEFGPRALLNRSIIADPSIPNINSFLNKKLRRTEFMPFAPACVFEDLRNIFELENHGSLIPFEFMTMTAKVKESVKHLIPAVVHIDGTARPQSVQIQQNPRMHETITKFKSRTGIPAIINTSFNAHEEPIVRGLEDGINSIVDNTLDYLVTENFVISKS